MRRGAVRRWIQRHPLWTTAAGVGIGVAAAFGLAMVVHYIIQPQMSREMWDRSILRGARFNLWYHQDSPAISRAAELRSRLEEELDDLSVRTGVELADLPLPIDVFVHDTVAQMQVSIGRRKSQQSGHLVYAVIDLMVDEDPRPRLTELILAFGWGECTSQILYTGTTMNIAHPDRIFHTAVAAAPERLRHSLEGLLALEARGEFPRTLYQRYDSPFSPGFVANLADIKALYYEFPSGLASPLERFEALEAASLVQHMIESNGLASIRAAWGPGTGEAVLARWSGARPLEEVGRSWREEAERRGRSAPDFRLRRAIYLFRAGDVDGAYETVAGWTAEDAAAPEAAEWAIRSALTVGRFDEAVARAAEAFEGEPPEPVRTWLEVFAGWRGVESRRVRALGSDPAALERGLAEIEGVLDLVFDGLEIAEEDRPARITLFLYADAGARELGGTLTPLEPVHRTCLHAPPGDDLAFAVAEALIPYAFGIETYSKLLRRGLAAALVREPGDLVTAGCELVATDRWRRLWVVDYTGEDPRIVDVEAGLMMRHVLDRYGPAVIEPVWAITSPSGRGASIDTAFQEVLGASRSRIEQELLEAVLRCGETVDRN